MTSKSETPATLNSQLLAVIADMIGGKAGKPEPDVFSIPDFCERHRISKSSYFNMRNAGFGPREMRVGGRVLISKEAAADWRKAREATTDAEVA